MLGVTPMSSGVVTSFHASFKLLYYAILWWRCSGILPNLLEIRYLGKLVDFKVSEKQLLDAEGELSARIGALETNLSVAPSKECLGSHCRYCDVRQFCNKYWCQDTGSLKGKKNKHAEDEGIGDLEVVISGEPSNSGFEAVTNASQKLSITYENNTGQIHGPFKSGERLRIIRGVMNSSPLSLELKPWSEVFHLHIGSDE